MKAEFKDISQAKVGNAFFLYGNYKKSFELFCEHIYEISLNQGLKIKTITCTFAEYLKMQTGSQCDLFDTVVNCFCIRNIEDKHLDHLLNLNRENSIFILECGNYFKSKKVSAELQKNKDFISIASFNNDMTFHSLCKMMLPKHSATTHCEIVKIIQETDESLTSLFKKISLLLDGDGINTLRNYSTYKKSFINDLDFIPLARYALQAAIKSNIFHQDQSYTKLKLENKIHFLLDAERKQKLSYALNKNYIFDCTLK